MRGSLAETLWLYQREGWNGLLPSGEQHMLLPVRFGMIPLQGVCGVPLSPEWLGVHCGGFYVGAGLPARCVRT